jgi:hypothetical protein
MGQHIWQIFIYPTDDKIIAKMKLITNREDPQLKGLKKIRV